MGNIKESSVLTRLALLTIRAFSQLEYWWRADADGFLTFRSVGDYGLNIDVRVLRIVLHQVSPTLLLKAKWTFLHSLSFQMKRIKHPSLCILSVTKRFPCRNTSRALILGGASRIQEQSSTKDYPQQGKCWMSIWHFGIKIQCLEGPFSCSPDKVDDIRGSLSLT